MNATSMRHQDPSLCVEVVDNLTVAGWFDAPTAEQMRVVFRIDQEKRRRVRGGVGFLNVIVGGIPSFSSEVRDAAAEQMALSDGRDRAAGHLILAEGLIGVAVRAFMSTAMLLARPSYPSKVFIQSEPLSEWMAPLLDDPAGFRWSPARIVACVERARRPPE